MHSWHNMHMCVYAACTIVCIYNVSMYLNRHAYVCTHEVYIKSGVHKMGNDRIQ